MSEYQLAALAAQYSNQMIYIADMDTYEIVFINDKMKRRLGLEPEEAWGNKKCYELFQNIDTPCSFCRKFQLQVGEPYQWEHYSEVLKRHFSYVDQLICLEGRLFLLVTATDITEEKEKQKELEYKLGVEETLVECIHVLSDYGSVEPALNRLLEIIANYYGGDRGYIFEIDYDQENFSNTYEWSREHTQPEIAKLQQMKLEEIQAWIQAFEEKGELYISSQDRKMDQNSIPYTVLSGHQIESLIAAPLIKDKKVVGFIGVDNPTLHTKQLSLLRSIPCFVQKDLEKRELLEKLEHTSYFDILTQVYNRNKYAQVLKELSQQDIASIGVIYLDLNGLKIANDTYGHDYGDYLIKQSALLLKECFSDNIFRLGGDEFLVLCANVGREEFGESVDRLRCGIKSNPLIEVSIGTTWSDKPEDLEAHISLADELMYVDKQSYYKANLAGEYNRNRKMVSELLESIRKGDFEVYLQPKVSLKDHSLIGAEALVRKLDSDGAVILPNQFLPVYEAEHIIRHVDLFVLETVCKTLLVWRKKEYPFLHISVNLSRVTLMENDIVKTIEEICQRYDVGHQWIGIEMSESVGAIQTDILDRLMKQFKQSGFSVSLDDFGSQYSNLAILSSMEFDHLKLDKNLVKGIESNEKSQMIIKSVIDLCKQFDGTKTVAEGVENEIQLKMLSDSKCDAGQGYLFSAPMTIDAFSNSYFENGS